MPRGREIGNAGVLAGFLFAGILAFASSSLSAQTTIEIYGGDAYSIPLPISIHQRGSPDINFSPHFRTDPWEDTWYYQFRVGLWKGSRAWLIELLHHKLYLDAESDFPSEVQRFDITNGFTMLTVSRAWRSRQTFVAVGGGAVVAYPITTVRGRRNGVNESLAGYHPAGVTVIGTLNHRLPIGKYFFIAAETRASLSYTRIPINGGHASVPNAALHLHLGAGAVLP